MKSSPTIEALRLASAALACVGLMGGACSDGGSGPRSEVDADSYIAGLAGEIVVQGAAELIDLPEADPSVTLAADGTLDPIVPVRAGGMLTVSIPFEAQNANVVAAGIGFSDGGQILTVPMPAMMGQASGTLAFSVQFPEDFCRNLGSICHSIVCYEYAITSDGKVSAANIVDMAAACGECTEPSCADLLPECPAAPAAAASTSCVGPNGDALPAAEILFSDVEVQELEVLGDSLYWVGGFDFYEAPKDGSAQPVAVIDDFSVTSFAFLGDSIYAVSFSDGVRQYSLTGEMLAEFDVPGNELVSDADSVYVYERSIFCDEAMAAEDEGIRRIDSSGQVTVIDAATRCITSLVAGEDSVYWIEGQEDDAVLFRASKQGGGAERMPLEVEDWGHRLLWGDGYLFAAGFLGLERGLPGGAAPEDLGIGFTLAAQDAAGAVIFTNIDAGGSCFLSVRGGGHAVPFASFDSSVGIPGTFAADADYVYYTDSFLGGGNIRRAARAP